MSENAARAPDSLDQAQKDSGAATDEIPSLAPNSIPGLTRIMELTRDRLFRFSLHLCGSVEVADDICQEVFFKLYRSEVRFESMGRLCSWLFTVARNHFVDLKRRQAVRPSTIKELGDEEAQEIINSVVDPCAHDPGAVVDLHRILVSLKPEDREVILLIDHEELEYSEVAAILGISTGALKSRVRRARMAFMKAHREADSR